MIPLTLAEIADAVGGRLHGTDGTAVVTGTVEFDSRACGPGSLFVALPGARVDGHEHAASALASGAVGVLAAREIDAPSVIAPPAGAGFGSGSYALAVDAGGAGGGVLNALARLARTVVDQLCTDGLTVVGITGSSGKTSTKDMVAALAADLGPTVAPPGSFNNEVGHPWTALRADATTRHLVLELSARGPGHIAALCEAARPRIGAVLNVGSAHLGEFGSRAAIAAAKGELVEALPADGVAVLNADDPAVAAMGSRTTARVVRFGRGPDADIRAFDERPDGAGRFGFRLQTPAGEAAVQLLVHGRHQVDNALAAAAVAVELGAPPDRIAAVLGSYRPVSRWRMEVTEAPGFTVVNDAYNANPESMRAALHAVVDIAGPSRRSWAVLGPMAELGDSVAAGHAELGRLATQLGVDRLVVVGAEAAPIAEGARRAGWSGPGPELVADVDSAVAVLRAGLADGDVVLIKASRAFGLERIADALLTGVAAPGTGR